jgi:hypothetical protein
MNGVHMKNCTLKLVAVSLITLGTGCASILNEKTQNVNIVTSSGRKAEVMVDGMPFQAPGVATFKRAKGDKIITTKDPKCNQTTVAPSTVDNVFFINVISGGVFGSTTDYGTEKMWKYQDTVIISCKE